VALQPFRQGSFAAGELATRLHGRHDLAKYHVGLRRARNVFIAPEGAALNRAGTTIVREAKDSAAAVDRGARFVPFVFSEVFGQAYLLEFGEGYLRFHVGGATIADPLAPAQPLELVTPYAAADLAKLKYAQQGDLVTLTCEGYVTQELRRLAHDSWEIGPISFDVPVPNGVVYADASVLQGGDATHPAKQWEWLITELWQDPTGLLWETSPLSIAGLGIAQGAAWVDGFTYPNGAIVTHSGTEYRSLQPDNLGHEPVEGAWWSALDVLYTSPPPTYLGPLPSSIVLYPDKTVRLWAPSTWGLTVPPENNAQLVGRRVYRGRGDAFGYVGEFQGQEFIDVGDLPDLTRTPPQGLNPFAVLDSGGALLRLENPSVVTYQDERRVFLGTEERPATAFCSRTGDYYNFDHHEPKVLDDAFELELAGRRREQIRWALGLEQLLVGTQSSIWIVRAVQGSPFGPGQVEAKIKGSAGSSWLDPLVISSDAGDAVLYVRTKGCGVRDLVFDDNRQGFVGSDLVVLARHFFTGYEIKAWAYQEDPWSVVWAVRSDGKLLSLTYVRDQEVWAWALHETQGLVEDVCVVPEGTEDAVYLLVKRQLGNGTWHRYVERMASRVVQIDPVTGRKKIEECVHVDGGVTVRGLAAGAPVVGLDHLEGLEVVALADGVPIHGLVVDGGQVTLPDDAGEGFDVVHVGLGYVAEAELLDLALPNANVRNQIKNVQRVAFELEASRGLEVAERFDAPDAEWTVWEPEDEEGGLVDGLFELAIFSTWNKGGRAAVRQREPLPCTLLAVTREADVGGA
jgi:hypothetical protein